MKTSIILPCLNELRHGYLERVLANLERQEGDKEIIAVVSPSEDGTEAAIAHYADRHREFTILRSSARNRAQRLNCGIAASTGNVIVLHHPATLLPERRALLSIHQALSQVGAQWGGFQHSFDLDHWLLRYTSWHSNHIRGRLGGILYLDHCPFVRADVLRSLGGVPDMDIFEDTVLSQKLRQVGKPVFVDSTVITSARRFQQRGIYRQALLNQMLKLAFHLGIDPQIMNRLYEQKSRINVNYDQANL